MARFCLNIHKSISIMKKYFIIVILVYVAANLQAQIQLNNPSFEAPPKDATMPPGWDGCGLYTTPDIMPGTNEWDQPIWDVTHKPVDGKTYMGLITREDNTWEYVAQKLSPSIKGNHCYMFSMDLASSPYYAGYNTPIRLRIWLGNESCKKEEMIASTSEVAHYEWKNYEFIFSTKKNYRYIIIEAAYVEGTVWPYRGNILIDNISPITDCNRA